MDYFHSTGSVKEIKQYIVLVMFCLDFMSSFKSLVTREMIEKRIFMQIERKIKALVSNVLNIDSLMRCHTSFAHASVFVLM